MITNQEQWLTKALYLLSAILIVLTSTITWLLSASILWLITVNSVLLPILYFVADSVKEKLNKPYYHLLYQLDALLVDDYSLTSQFKNNNGIAGQVFTSLTKLSQQLSNKHQLFDENNLLVHSLIQALDSPVLLLNDKQQLIHGNQALSLWLEQDWRLVRLTKVEQLGFSYHDHHWQMKNQQQSPLYKIRSSQFTLANQQHQLLILTDISSELRQMQLKSWQQLIRVLTHEIKNSLTPIKSLAQTLRDINQDKEQQSALNVIVERSQNLNDFVANYGQITRVYQLKLKPIKLTLFIEGIIPLYPNINFSCQFEQTSITADEVLLQQVFINLIENAQQAFISRATDIDINNKEQCQLIIKSKLLKNVCLLTLTDNGAGIQNTDNLFVPFYTTKANGNGIGLSLCRNVIEQHGGQLTLINNTNNNDNSAEKTTGACAQITIPL